MKAHENPFRAVQIEKLPFRFENRNFEELLVQLASFNDRGAIVGVQGSGKTTLLELLHCHYIDLGRTTSFFNFEQTDRSSLIALIQKMLSLPEKTVLFVDGADSLSAIRWNFICGIMRIKQFGCIITSHRTGMLPTLIECNTSVHLFRELLGKLIPDHPILTNDPFLESLYSQHEGNIRLCFRDLYDYVSRRNFMNTDM